MTLQLSEKHVQYYERLHYSIGFLIIRLFTGGRRGGILSYSQGRKRPSLSKRFNTCLRRSSEHIATLPWTAPTFRGDARWWSSLDVLLRLVRIGGAFAIIVARVGFIVCVSIAAILFTAHFIFVLGEDFARCAAPEPSAVRSLSLHVFLPASLRRRCEARRRHVEFRKCSAPARRPRRTPPLGAFPCPLTERDVVAVGPGSSSRQLAVPRALVASEHERGSRQRRVHRRVHRDGYKCTQGLACCCQVVDLVLQRDEQWCAHVRTAGRPA